MSAHVALTLPNMTINGYTTTLTLSGESGAELIRILKDMQAADMTKTMPGRMKNCHVLLLKGEGVIAN